MCVLKMGKVGATNCISFCYYIKEKNIILPLNIKFSCII